MYYLIYISTSKRLLTEPELLDILTVSRRNNYVKNVTGMLLYAGGTFMQVLEGEEAVVKEVYQKVEQDTRHKNLIQLITGTTDHRNFPDWNMAFASVNSNILVELESYMNPREKGFLDDSGSNTVFNMLKTFAESNHLN